MEMQAGEVSEQPVQQRAEVFADQPLILSLEQRIPAGKSRR
jgi:hypothetical protein